MKETLNSGGLWIFEPKLKARSLSDDEERELKDAHWNAETRKTLEWYEHELLLKKINHYHKLKIISFCLIVIIVITAFIMFLA